MADQSLSFQEIFNAEVTAETNRKAAEKGMTPEAYRAEIIASNAAANAAADANIAKSKAAWAALTPAQKAEWGGYPDALLTEDETYED